MSKAENDPGTVREETQDNVKKPEEEAVKSESGHASKQKKEESKKKDKQEALKIELDKAKSEADEAKDLLLRTAAEFDNYKRRTLQEKERIGSDTRASTIKELLPVLDSLTRAVENSGASPDDLKKGVEMTVKQFFDLLSRMGLEEIEAQGKEFDPNLHYAVSKTDDESVGDNIIVTVMQKGYKIGETVIRPAMVTVANC